jgi:hypothetical protein
LVGFLAVFLFNSIFWQKEEVFADEVPSACIRGWKSYVS